MDLQEALLLHNTLLDEQKELVEKQLKNVEQIIEIQRASLKDLRSNSELPVKETELKPDSDPIPKKDSKEGKFFDTERRKSQRIPHEKLAVFVKEILDDSPFISKQHMVSILRDKHGLEWANFSDVIGSLNSKGLLNIKITRKEGRTFYFLDK